MAIEVDWIYITFLETCKSERNHHERDKYF